MEWKRAVSRVEKWADETVAKMAVLWVVEKVGLSKMRRETAGGSTRGREGGVILCGGK
jgi:hypothetical protein